MKILLLENHEHFARAVVKEFLSEHDVDNVPSVKEAIKLVSNEKYDVVLSDYDLDDGKGDEFLSYLKESGKSIPAIAISSHEAGNKALCNAGAKYICSKMEFRNINEELAKINV